jgi:hypothetical protein
MDQNLLDDAKIKELFKTALAEMLEERRDLLVGAVEEALEDLGLARAIREGEGTCEVSQQEVFSSLESGGCSARAISPKRVRHESSSIS